MSRLQRLSVVTGQTEDGPLCVFRPGESAMAHGDALIVLDCRDALPDPAALCHPGAWLLLTESAEAAGAWMMLEPGRTVAVIAPTAAPRPKPHRRFGALGLLLGAEPDALSLRRAEQAVAWAEARGLAHGVLDPIGARGLASIARFGPPPSLPYAVLDLRAGTDLLASPAAMIEALADGAPVLFCDPSPTRDALGLAGAGRLLEDLAGGLRSAFAAAGALSAAALAWTAAQPPPGPAFAAACRAARLRRDAAAPAPPVQVLVVSDEGLNLIDIRVHRPLGALLARGVIAGYSVLRYGHFVFATEPVTPALRFGAIWVQRSYDPLIHLLLRVLARPFVYDLDDLLLVSPSYRAPFPEPSAETVRALIADARVVSVATPRLARLIERHGAPALGKAVLTPNLGDASLPVMPGPVRTIIWPSSDAPALAGAAREVQRAVRDFARAHNLPILCLGALPPKLFAGLVVEHVGLVGYDAYLARLRAAAPAILLAPLDTAADADTQDFIDAKSDIKLLEAGMTGLVVVASRAAPYVDTDLADPILCDNTYAAWLDGLEQARRRCAIGVQSTPLPDARALAGSGPLAWAAAIARAPTDLSAEDVAAALRWVRAQGETLLTTPDRFDEADYLRRHPDVADAVQGGQLPSGYRHYVQSGFREGRAVRRLAGPDAAADFWWSRLLHRTDRIEAQIAARQATIDGLSARRALRFRLPAMTPAPTPIPEGAIDWSIEGDVAGPCPVCGAPGPHPAVLAYMGQTLGRCRVCRTRFYAERTAYDYEDPDHADLLLQVTLEQNASIYHQTRPLFAVEGASSLLDVGCGLGFAVDMAARLGWRAVGLDPSFYARAGQRLLGADLRPTYLTEATDPGPRFDLALASEVIEHLPEPYAFLTLLRRHLAEAGTLVLSTPDADAIAPATGPARLLAILAPRVHLVLFTRQSLALALQRAGFGHIDVQSSGDTLVAYASDRMLRLDPNAPARHDRAYEAYLRGLLDRAAPGTPLWNGAAGRLLAWLAPSADPATLHALLDRIEAAWTEAFGPGAMTGDGQDGLGARPFNLPGVLLARAELTARTPGRTPGDILAAARPAYRAALGSGRALQRANIVDHDLRQTARRARMLILDALAESAPELEPDLLQGLLTVSPPGLSDWVDPPAPMALPRLAAAFASAVGQDRFDDARRLEPAVRDIDDVCRTLDGQDDLLLQTLFALGRLRLQADRDPQAALLVFRRMHGEASRRRGRSPAVRAHLAVASRHVRLATDHLTTHEAEL